MKRLLGFLTALVLVATFAMGLTACGKNDSDDAQDAITIKYTLNDDDEDDEYYVLSGFTISDEAQKLVTKGDYAALAKLFNDQLGKETYTEESVRKFTVASEYKGENDEQAKPVKEISASAVSGLSFITEIEVPSTIEKIAGGAFNNLTSLEKITLPFVGEKIGAIGAKKSFGYIFGTVESDGLTACEQKPDDGNTSSTTYYVPSTLKTVVITGDNTTEAAQTIYYKLNLSDNTKYSLTKEEYDAFIDNDEYVKKSHTVAGKNNYAVPAYAFYGCTTLENVTLSGNIGVLEAYTFSGCTSLKTFDISVSEIGEYAFNGCTSLESVDFTGVTKIGEYAFNGCTSLGKESTVKTHPVQLGGVTEIGEFAFNGCTAITDVELNVNGVIVNKCAFKGCTKLASVVNKDKISNVIGADEDPFIDCDKLNDED